MSKPMHFGIRFLALVDWVTVYLLSLQNNRYSNNTEIHPVVAFSIMFQELRMTLTTRPVDKITGHSSPSAM